MTSRLQSSGIAALSFTLSAAVLALALVLAGAAVVSKIERRKVDGSPLPFYSIGFIVVLVAILIAFSMGLLSL